MVSNISYSDVLLDDHPNARATNSMRKADAECAIQNGTIQHGSLNDVGFSGSGSMSSTRSVMAFGPTDSCSFWIQVHTCFLGGGQQMSASAQF